MVSIAVVASDRITGEGAACYLRAQRGLKVLPEEEHRLADVLLVLTVEVTEETLLLMEGAAAASTNAGMGIVLVTGGLHEAQVMRAVHCGLRSVMWRQDAGYEAVVEAVRTVAAGRAALPAPVQGWLLDHVGSVYRHVLRPMGVTSSGLEGREVEILRLLADGFSTVEIARRLSYSERTIKNIVSAMTSRLGLRNRAHAVAFALRSGTLR
ncbi:response regulator transcription factor [Kitasatospora sp. NPDC057015]|uniref:response regulator transcription factor n=1 Tax=Kitasatospora sp. NPDC057015 TaxID=3346001 RepID=UPI00363666D3